MNTTYCSYLACISTLWVLGLTGCADESAQPLSCDPAEEVACACPSGALGTQICAASGEGFGDCVCDSDPDVVAADTATGDTFVAGDGAALDTAGPTDTGLPACDPPLAIVPSSTYANTYSLVAVQASGGSGDYAFEAVTLPSGGTLNALTGSYLTGSVVDVVDVLRVVDSTCVGQAEVSIQVVAIMQVSPQAVELEPSDAFVFDAWGGSGAVVYTLATNATGASIDSDGHYESGGAEGDDVVAVTDEWTGQVATVIIEVREGAQLRPDPEVLVLPLGATFQLNVAGGSGVVDVLVNGDAVACEDGVVTALIEGESTLDVLDLYTGAATSVVVRVVVGLPYEGELAGDHLGMDHAAGPGDVNGDGYADAVLGVAEVHLDWANSGAVYVYAGGPDGLNPTPVRVISGSDRDARFGAQVVTEDVDGDGRVDLLVAAPRASYGALFAGAVFLYRGVEGGFFEQSPSQVWTGDNGYDYFGTGLTVCDFNGDGLPDMAISARYGEDRGADPVVSGQGAVHLFLGHATGLPIAANQQVWGHGLGAGGEWEPMPLQLGVALASGDLDGDGRCELIASVYKSDADDQTTGAVYAFRGRAPAGFGKGGLSKLPVRAFYSDIVGDFLGRTLAVGDFDADGMADLIIGHGFSIHGGKNEAGAIYRFAGGALPSEFQGPEAVTDADWAFIGQAASDHEGWALAVGDMNGDEVADLLVGSRRSEGAGLTNNTGSAKVFLGSAGSPFASTPDLASYGVLNGDFYGGALAILGDVDGTGSADILVYAPRSDAVAYDFGMGYQVSFQADTAVLNALEQPAMASGHYFGKSVAIHPIVGGTTSVALVAASRHDTENTFHRGALLGFGLDGTTTPEVSYVLGAIPKSGSGDLFGSAIASIGDFNGDGHADVAVVREADYMASSFDSSMICGSSCAVGEQGNQGCAENRSYPGSVAIFGGTADGGINPIPLFYYYGPEAKQTLRSVAAAGDVNGDGLADVLVGSYRWDDGLETNTGGVRLVYGRPQAAASQGKVEIICVADFVFHGHAKDDGMGRGLTTVGDLDGDGCDEFSVGSDGEDPSNRGVVRVFFGWNAQDPTACQASEATYIALSSGANSSRSGWSLAGGLDVDGDGVPDLVIGAPQFRVQSSNVGAVWLVRGAYLLELPREVAVTGEPPTLGPHSLAALTEEANLRLTGRSSGAEFGAAVALVPQAEADGRARVLVGAPGSNVPGVSLSGAAMVFRFDTPSDAGFRTVPWLTFGGESERPGSRIGDAVAAGTTLTNTYLLVGGYRGTSHGTGSGSAYVFNVGGIP